MELGRELQKGSNSPLEAGRSNALNHHMGFTLLKQVVMPHKWPIRPVFQTARTTAKKSRTMPEKIASSNVANSSRTLGCQLQDSADQISKDRSAA